ncbi:MAG: hypothetical protein JRE40_04635 [Deltaproteobacteria bacterium]|nr:hypothetical protein [Deltaproteobacteria bacterium]
MIMKHCPILGGPCLERNCAWYQPVEEQCSIFAIANNLDAIVEEVKMLLREEDPHER